MHFRTPGIRGKLLSFSGLVLALVVILELFAQAAASSTGREFETRIARYHAIHRLRVTLAEHRALTDRYLREAVPELLSPIAGGAETLARMARDLEPFGRESLEAMFEVRATRRGIEAYLPLVASSTEKRKAGRSDHYADFARADRIAGYTDGYLTKLLTASMNTGELEYKAAARRARSARNLSLGGVLSIGAVSLVFALVFASSITAPIRRLARSAGRMASGELDIEPVSVASRDEVGTLAKSFNAMSENIRILVRGLEDRAELERRLHDEELSLVVMGRALREAQFMNLQDQMRPHFLFNALNTVARSASAEQAPVTERLSRGLARIMRYALATEGAFVPLEHELGIVREYLAFQHARFGDRIAWSIRIAQDAGDIVLPRFTLQPVVENSVRHGIEPRVEGGRVVISVRKKNGRARIMVGDSGIGMSASLVGRLRSVVAGGASGSHSPGPPSEKGTGIGLANLKSRLAYRYGDSIRVGIASRTGRGTIVRITFPLQEADTV